MAEKDKNNNSLVFADNGYLSYIDFSKLSLANKLRRRLNIAKAQFDNGSLAKAGYALVGGYDPENPRLSAGEVPNPGMRNPKDIIRLFRATGTSGKFKPSLDGTQEFSGQWFTNNIRKPLRYASSTFKKAKISKESNPVELQVVEIPASEINKYKASELLKGRTDIEYEPTEDFLIPLDYPRLKYSIEGLTGNLLLDMRLKLPIEKQGGKMNILEFLKKGSGIHIKKKNRGKFTSYCGGKVTDECIRKAKASGNPTLVKRATFADNARHFKHKKGRLIKAYDGTKLGQSILNGVPQLIEGIYLANQLSKWQDEFNNYLNNYSKYLKNNIDTKGINLQAQLNLELKKLMNPTLNFGQIDLLQEQKRLTDEALLKAEQEAKWEIENKRMLFNNQISAIKGENTNSIIGSIFNIGKTALLNYKPKSSENDNTQQTGSV